MTLREILDSLKSGQALLHTNFATFEQFKAGIEAVKQTNIPLIFGVSERERDYLNEKIARELVFVYTDDLPILLNADHTKSVERAKKAIDLGYDAVLFDGAELNFDDNVARTKDIIEYRNRCKAVSSKQILIEGELGYLPGHSDLEGEIEIKSEYLTKPEEAGQFVQETQVDLLAVSVGNIHGIPAIKPQLDFERIRQIKNRVKIPLVLHGGSGLTDEDLKNAISAGVKVIHLNTEFRKIWKDELVKEVNNQQTVVPYKILEPVVQKIKERIIYYQKLFWQG